MNGVDEPRLLEMVFRYSRESSCFNGKKKKTAAMYAFTFTTVGYEIMGGYEQFVKAFGKEYE